METGCFVRELLWSGHSGFCLLSALLLARDAVCYNKDAVCYNRDAVCLLSKHTIAVLGYSQLGSVVSTAGHRRLAGRGCGAK